MSCFHKAFPQPSPCCLLCRSGVHLPLPTLHESRLKEDPSAISPSKSWLWGEHALFEGRFPCWPLPSQVQQSLMLVVSIRYWADPSSSCMFDRSCRATATRLAHRRRGTWSCVLFGDTVAWGKIFWIYFSAWG